MFCRSFARSYLTRTGPPKYVTPSEAVESITSGSKLYAHSVAAFPKPLFQALANRHSHLSDVEIYQLHLETENPCAAYSNSFRINNYFIGANQRKAVNDGLSCYTPCFLSDIPVLMRKRIKPIDYALLNVSPPDRHGYCSLGVEVCCAFPAAETAKHLIAQINPSMPRTHGTGQIHIDAFDYVTEANIPLPEKTPAVIGPIEQQIGKIIAELVPDGATIQMGIGAIPNAVLKELIHHKNLGIHTEMFEDEAIDLIEKGVVTNLEKAFLPGRVVTSFVMGTKRIYDFVDDNPGIVFLDASITNNPRIIASNPKMTAINSCIQIDLTGQVCADSVGKYMVSGVGGQVDFERGAALASHGIPIIAMTSEAKHGQSRIVDVLDSGAGVVTTRNHVHYVVTEYGAVDLFGKSLRERAEALIKIAHPNHREKLYNSMVARFGWK